MRYSIFIIALLSGCAAVGPNYQPPKTRVPASFGEVGGATTQPSKTTSRAVEITQWWATFGDPELDSLIDRAVAGNYDLQEAESRIRQARSQLLIARADQLPELDSSAGYSHQRYSGTGPFSLLPEKEFNLYQAGFDASWEIDVFGRVRRSVEAANADARAAMEDQRDVYVTLLGDVARNYVELRGAQRRLAIAKQNLASQEQTLDLIRSRNRAGFVTNLDVSRQAAQVATTASAIPAFETAAANNIHALGTLLGQDPESLADELTPPAPIPPTPPEVPVGVPAEMLRRRPDIRRAENQLAAATARVGVATADLYPRFTLSGNINLEGDTIGHFTSYDSRAFGFGPALSWPIFDAGRIRANIAVSNERQKQSLLNYQQTVLGALREVEDALASFRNEQARRASLADAVTNSRDATDLARQQYEKGVIDFLTVLDAQRVQFDAEDALVQSDRDVSTSLVALYKALGGGWEAQGARDQVR
jgi:NodT family efflux transporter outer membrane factor (OMF) lipoprotein